MKNKETRALQNNALKGGHAHVGLEKWRGVGEYQIWSTNPLNF